MATEALSVKGDKQGIKLIINATFSLTEILNELKAKLLQNPAFFQGAAIKLESNTLELLSKEEYDIITEYLQQSFQDISVSDYRQYAVVDSEEKEEVVPTKFMMGTIRSGQHLKYPGNLIILGDVNGGAQIEADGNICVMGVVRGTVHAGFAGDDRAFISCKRFEAPQAQIRIASLIVRAEQDDKTENTAGLEIAHIENETIVVFSKE